MKSIFIAAAIAFVGAAHAEVITILGLPLGGKLSSAIRNCPSDLTKQTQLCWLGKPYRASDGSVLGGVSIRDKDLPAWASGHFPQAHLSKDGVLMSLDYLSNERMFRERSAIVESVRSRFGTPSVIEGHGAYSAKWESIPGRIEIGCIQGNCYLKIISTPMVEQLKAEKLKRENELKSRPSTL